MPLALSGVGQASAAALWSVTYAVTIGEPSAPTETVRLVEEPGGSRLAVERRAADGTVLDDAETRLPAGAVAPLRGVIEDRDLLVFRPRVRGRTRDVAPDYGERRLEIVRSEPAIGVEVTHAVRWLQPLDNEARIAPLLRALGTLSRTHLPQVPLYFVPTD